MGTPSHTQPSSSPGFHFDEANHRYTRADGLYVPSVTQILKRVGFADYSQVQADVLERASIRGTAVHKVTEFLDVEMDGVPESEIDLSPVNPEYVPYVQAWLRFKRESGVQILDTEQQCVSELNGMPFGMKYDTLALVNGREALLEKKTCSQEYAYWGIQLAGYELGLPQCKTQLRRNRYAVALRDDASYRVYTYNNEADYQAFEWSLAICWMQLNRGAKFEEPVRSIRLSS